jgi:putative copper resistance protein D
MPAMSFLAVAIYSADAPLYPTYATLPPPWGPGALEDQRNAAELMWVAGNLALVVAIVLVAASWKRHDDEAQRRLEAREDAAEAGANR